MRRKQKPAAPLELLIPAPEHLSDRCKSLWTAAVPGRAKSVPRLALLQTALEALDRANECREAVAREGMTLKTETTGALHVHPLVKVEAEARRQFATIWKMLDLEADRFLDPRFSEKKSVMDRLLE